MNCMKINRLMPARFGTTFKYRKILPNGLAGFNRGATTMTTYAYTRGADAHLFPARPNYKSLLASVRDVFTQFENAMAKEKAIRELNALPDYLLRDIGIERHTIAS